MTIRKRTKLLIAALALSCTCIFAGVTISTQSHAQATEIIFNEELNESYTLGATLDVPSAKISYDGVEYTTDANVLLYYPSGAVYEGESFALTEEGIYTIVYSATVNGAKVTADKVFKVTNNPYSVTGDSSFAYVDALHTQNANVGAQGGLSVELSMNGKFEYNKPIDISSATANTPILTFAPYQYSNYGLTSSGVPVDEVNEIFVRLTDAHNPDVYVDWFFVDRTDTGKVSLTRGYPYASAGANGQDLIALDPNLNRYYDWIHLNNSRLVTVDGVQYAGVYGPWGGSLGTIPSGENIETDGTTIGNGGQISIFLDVETNRPYAEVHTKNGNSFITKRLWLTDLDESGIQGDNLFKGFSTGEVYLSVWAEEYLGDKFHFDILDIYGTSFSNLSLQKNFITDEREPTLQLKKTLPSVLYAKVGENILLPEVVAYDVHLKEVSSTIFYLKGTNLQRLVSVKNDTFIPSGAGIYTVTYIATDTFGNTQTLEIEINAVADDVLTLETTKIGEMEAGQWVSLPDYEVLSLNGDMEVKAYIAFGEEREEIDLSDPKFFLRKVGEYTVEYIFSDALSIKSYSYKFNTIASDNITFDDFALPRYMIKNAKYTIDPVNAYEYKSQEPTAKAVDIYVKEDNGEFVKLTGAYQVGAENKVQFKYVYGSAEIVSDEIPVVDAGFGSALMMDKYFISRGDVETSATKNGVIISDATGGTEKIEFINEVPFSTFRFAFSLQTSGTVDSVSIKLTDYYDLSKTMEIKLTPRGEAITLNVNGATTELSKSLYGTDLEFSYNASVKSILEKNGGSLAVETPFTSNRVFLEFSVEDATSAFEMSVTKVGNQLMSSATRDRFPGTITYEDLFAGVNAPGTTVTVYGALGVDVLSPYYDGNMKVSVRDLDNNYVTSTDGILLQGVLANREYQFVVEKGKTYIVGYEFLDQAKQSQTISYNIIGLSVEDPSITLENDLDSRCIVRAKVGASVKVANYEAKSADGTTNGITVLIYIVTPNEEIYHLTKDAFVAKDKGEYTVLYSCVDEDRNFAMQSYTVIAE